jgi:hypothetical protein
MSPMKKVMIFSALIFAPILLATAIWLGIAVLVAFKDQKFMTDFEKIHETKPPLSVAQVEQLMGQPLRIDQSESADQTISGQVYHYPTYPAGGDFQVIFINEVVFNTALAVYHSPHSGNQLIIDVLTGKS